ncbi:WbqC family protein [Sporosarcina koreensis]|uniref:WbqC family protein n=1 Tax=Sporosarcina koreensis TaxID=334735 RepID=UPI0013663DD5|nr:WbqC family protein [Sporosarcina koreensis]
MQPTYLPWIGYFHMMAQVETFVFLDDVQFSKRSWQQRNKIDYEGKEKWVTIPTITKGLRHQKILDVRIDNTVDWQSQHSQLIKHAYSKKPFYNDLEGILELYKQECILLSDFTTSLIVFIAKELDIVTDLLKSSDIPVTGIKSSYLFNICEYLGASSYLSASGSKEYIEAESVFEKSNVRVNYHQGDPYIYPHHSEKPFIPYLSIIDYIANRGFDNFKKEILL